MTSNFELAPNVCRIHLMPGGGYPDKIGNHYEQQWVLHQLVALVSSKQGIQSLEWEPAGDDARGIDLWVNYDNKMRNGYQCKLKNGSKGTWSIADLASNGILSNLRFQVERDPERHRFNLVSGAPSPDFEDLCKAAEHSRDSASFLEAQIKPVRRLRALFGSFCQAVGLDQYQDISVRLAWHLLQSSRFHLFHHTDQHKKDMAERLAPWVTSEPLLALSVLETFVAEKLRQQIDIEVVEKRLRDCGIKLLRGVTDRWRHSSKEVFQKRRDEGQLQRLNAELEAVRLEVRRELQSGATVQKLTERWSLFRLLGEGRFGRVFLAYDSHKDRDVAAKILHVEFAHDSKARDLFYFGGLAIANLELPTTGLVRVLEPPHCWEGNHFYIMEYFAGRRLCDWVNPENPKGELPTSEFAWKVIRGVGKALGSLHRNNFIHCDVAPQNILVSSNGEVKLADFDLLRRRGAPQAGGQSNFLSLPYTAPEMLDGCGDSLPETDIYSLALVSIYLLYGKELPIADCTQRLDSFIENLPCPRATKLVLRRATGMTSRYKTVSNFLGSLGPRAFQR